MSASFRDPSSFQTQGWLHELAKAENLPEAEQLLGLNRSFDPKQIVEESTIDFLGELKACFTEYARVLNGYAEGGARFGEIKIFSVAQAAADFMLYRNQIKLVVSNAAHGVIRFEFTQHVRNDLGVSASVSPQSIAGANGSNASLIPQELLAQIGPFRDIVWTYKGERVFSDKVAQFFFTEFVRLTRDQKKSRLGNQALLDQIKALLNEKGLEI